MKGNLKMLPENLEKEKKVLLFFMISLVYCNLRNYIVVHEKNKVVRCFEVFIFCIIWF